MYSYKIRLRKIHYFIVSLFHCFIIFSCAQPSTPTGGPKDTTPPTIVESKPANYSTNFHQKEIKIEFDEWIQPLVNAQNQVIISPNIEPFPKIEAARNELTIKLKDSLQANTTYSIFFGDHLKDNNEGNIFPNFKYIFSTGNFIDSLYVKGVLNTSLDKIPDNTYLLLYIQKEDSAFTQKRPFYITKITADGSFNLENVKEGDYRIYALSDKNGNYFYDLPTEAIGFTDTVFRIRSNIDTLSFTIFLPEDSVLRIFSYDRTVNNGILHVTFNKELSFTKDEITVSVYNDSTIQPIAFQENHLNIAKDKGSTIAVYLPKIKSDTNNFTLVLKNNGKLIDTLRINTETKKSKKPLVFFNDSIAYKSLVVIESQSLKLRATNYSLSSIDTDRIFITDTSKIKIPFIISRNEDLQTYLFTANWKSGMKYNLKILDSALIDLVGNYNKNQEFSFLAQSAKKAGNLLVIYELPEKSHQYIILLKDNSGKVLDKQIIRDSQLVKINYGLQPAGTFSIEVINDANQNGIWNSGNFKHKTLPERIYKELKPIIIKENWDAEETVHVNFDIKTNNNLETLTKDSAKIKSKERQ